MANHDVMLTGGTSFRQRFVSINGKLTNIKEVLANARDLQATAVAAKLRGDKLLAIKLYRALKPYLRVIDEYDLCGLPIGLPLQVLQHTLDQLETA
jgi:hypothetical protein